MEIINALLNFLKGIFGGREPLRASIRMPDGSAHEVLVQPGQTLLTAAVESGVPFPHGCRVGACGACACVRKAGRASFLQDISLTLSAADLKADFILACQALPESDLEVEVPKKSRDRRKKKR